MQKPPPDWLTGWAQFVVVQLVAAGGLLIAAWKWLTKPIKEQLTKIERRQRRHWTAFKKDSFGIRTELTSILGRALEAESRLDLMDEKILHREAVMGKDIKALLAMVTEMRGEIREIRQDLGDITERLAALEGLNRRAQ